VTANEITEKMQRITELLINKTLIRMEKETKISGRTLKMISLSLQLFTSIRCWLR